MNNNEKLFVIIDVGHSKETKGKRSVDSTLFEYQYNRKIGKLLHQKLKEIPNVESFYIVTEDEKEITLTERARRANNIYKQHNLNKNNCIFISIHANASGNGTQWNNASGCSVFVSPKASNNSKLLASIYTNLMIERHLEGNRSIPKVKYWIGDFTVLNKTLMPSILTENLFYTNKEECEYMKTDECINTITNLHIDMIKQYFNKINNQQSQ